MTPEHLQEKIGEKIGNSLLESNLTGFDPIFVIEASKINELCTWLKAEISLAFDSVMCISGVDSPEDNSLVAVYHLHSFTHNHRVCLKVKVPKSDPKVPSVTPVWKAADWHEREAYDLLGIEFVGHPNLKRILLPKDWVGHPLRKDYQVSNEWHGMKIPYSERVEPNAEN